MKEIDFLPQSFYDAWIRRLRTRRNIWFCVALAISLGLLHFTTAARARKAQAALVELHEQTGGLQTERARVEALHARKQMLERNAVLISELDDDAPLDAVIGTVTRLMTPSMALRGVGLEVQQAGGTGSPATPGEANAGKSAIAERGRTELVLNGVAASDVEVGAFFGKLGASALFQDVRLTYSREAEHAGRQMREFELRAQIKRVSTTR